MASIAVTLQELAKIGGFIGGAIVNAESGLTLGTIGGGADFDVEMAAAANKGVVSAKLRAAQALELGDNVDDILITLSTQYHLIRMLTDQKVFIYIALSRETANLALARLSVTKAASTIEC